MSNAFLLFRTLVIYGICLPLAIFVGYLLATPTDVATYAWVGLLFGLMMIPLFLRWHYPWLIFFWNATVGLYFLPGKPSMSLLLVWASFSISVLAYIMNRDLKFISVPSITRPLLFLGAVVFGTAKLTGGIGLNMLGSESMGGKRYLFLFTAIVGYFALVAQRIPANKAKLFMNLFLFGSVLAAAGELTAIVSPNFYFIFLFFPPDVEAMAGGVGETSGILRLGGLAIASIGVVSILLANYGIEGVLNPRKYGRFFLFGGFMVLSFFGGFRSMIISLLLLCAVMFLLEGLFRSRLLPGFILAGMLLCALVIPFASRLPLSVQRSLAFLPLALDKDAVANANASVDWRVDMWKTVIPTIPQYLVLGKGLAIDARELEMLNTKEMNKGEDTAAAFALSGDYHNGPLSVIIPFGIFGAIGFLWFLIASGRVLWRNYKYGDPEYERYNRFLYAYFLVKVIIFFAIFGSFYSDLLMLVGPVGLSVALNGGVKKPAMALSNPPSSALPSDDFANSFARRLLRPAKI